ncbi:MAG: hypothetical protein V1872_00535 [bacterium]
MPREPILKFIKQLDRPVFTTYELSLSSGKSLSVTTQALNHLVKEGVLIKIARGIWGEIGNESLSPFAVIPLLLPRHRVYVSFISSLHMYGIIEQIPQVITLASTAHTRKIKTSLGTFQIHRLDPLFFDGFDWYKERGTFLIATPEKALADSLYLSACKKKQFGHFPELYFPGSFSFKKVREWVGKIPNPKIRSNVLKKLNRIYQESKRPI